MRRLVFLGLTALLDVGCVPVCHPIGDPDKSEPDKALVGTWSVTKRSGLTIHFGNDDEEVAIDAAPAVKGNPKGLMRAVASSNADDEMWFFVTTFDKHAYANLIQPSKENDKGPNFGQEGVYAKWQDEEHKRFFVLRYALDGNTLTVNSGNHGTIAELMKDAHVTDVGQKYVPLFRTEPKWADTIFAKGGADKVYDGVNVMVLKRKKK